MYTQMIYLVYLVNTTEKIINNTMVLYECVLLYSLSTYYSNCDENTLLLSKYRK